MQFLTYLLSTFNTNEHIYFYINPILKHSSLDEHFSNSQLSGNDLGLKKEGGDYGHPT